MLPAQPLAAWRDRLWAALHEHPRHHLDWRLRQALYLELGNQTASARAFRAWLALLCAQKVLPLTASALPHEPLPFRLIGAGLTLLRGQVPAEDLQRLQDDAYHFVCPVGLDGRWPHNAERAIFTGYKALLEIQGWSDPFAGFGPEWVTTEELAIQSAGSADAASSAAVAWACTPDSLACDPARLREFWAWWLNQAWPAALRLAELYPHAGEHPPRIGPSAPPVAPDDPPERRPEAFGEDDWPEPGVPPG